ncbi:Ubinuclein 2 [Nesidiocoris tenuis]|uniref:Ubinuclein 2 n=1 Tax=Nesidiocoris tenuis TaxID=355587 RepID=A0ABN7AVY5_9HEMI|nr:Ubinuclein 2 [Nesidiocoris tenuis]
MNDPKFARLDPMRSDPLSKKVPDPTEPKEKSVRLNIDLTSYSKGPPRYIFSYEDLVKKARAKAEAQGQIIGSLPDLFGGDSDELKRIASKYEEKYSEKGKYKSYAELASGYDEEDSFIDNTEANEEGIPEEMDTKKGGFYINSGRLELTHKK